MYADPFNCDVDKRYGDESEEASPAWTQHPVRYMANEPLLRKVSEELSV